MHVHAEPALYPIVLQVFAAQRIERFINLSGGAPGDGLDDVIAQSRRHAPRIAVCTNVDWDLLDLPDFGARMARDLDVAAKLGAVCLKVPKALGLGVRVKGEPLLAVDDKRLEPLWSRAADLRFPVFIHVADPKAFWEPLTPQNERYSELSIHPRWSFADARFPRRETLLTQFENLLRDNPRTTFVGVHFGNDPEDIAATDRRLDTFPNLMIDTAARVGEIGRANPDTLRAFFIKHQKRVLFGTDLGVTRGGIMLGSTDGKEPTRDDALRFFTAHWRFFETRDRAIPHPTPIQGNWTVDAIGLPDDVLDRFYRDNALSLVRWP